MTFVLPLARTIVLTDNGTAAFSAKLAIYDGTPIGPVTPELPAFAGLPSITTDGAPQVGETLTGVDASILRLGSAVLRRAWLLGTTVLTEGATFTPDDDVTYTFRNELVVAGLVVATVSIDVAVQAATVTPAPTPTRIPKPVISIVAPGENPPQIAIEPDSYLAGDHLILRIYDDPQTLTNLIVDDHVLTQDEVWAEDVTWEKLTARPAGKHYYDVECVRNGVSGGVSVAVSDTVAAVLVAPRFVQNDSTGAKPTNDGYTVTGTAESGNVRRPYNTATPHGEGKLCAELTLNARIDAVLFGYAAAANMNQGQYPGLHAAPSVGFGYNNGPFNVYGLAGATSIASFPDWNTGDVILLCFDFSMGPDGVTPVNRAYMKRNGVWVLGNADTGTDGLDISNRGTTPVYLTAVVGGGDTTADQATLTATTTPPAGYTYWS